MKNFKSIFLTLALFMMSSFGTAQTLTEIPTPVGFTNNYRGYSKGVIEYQNHLYLKYTRNDNSSVLHKFDGTTLTAIPTPAEFDVPEGGYLTDDYAPIIVDEKLYLSYSDGTAYIKHLISYDGSNLIQIPTPTEYLNTNGGVARSLNKIGNNVIGAYDYGSDNKNDLFKYNGSDLTIYPTPATHKGRYVNDFPPTLIGNTFFMKYFQNNENFDLFKFDGTTLTEIPSPPGFENPGKGCRTYPYVFGNALFMAYTSNSVVNVLFKYENDVLTSIPHSEGLYYDGFPIEFNSNLYLKYTSNNGIILVKYDGTSLTEIPSPSGYNQVGLGYVGGRIIYNNNLYLKYVSSNGNSVLMKYDGNNLTPIPSPAGFDGPNQGYYGAGESFIFEDNLYMRYVGGNTTNNYSLVKFDGTSITVIENLAGYDAANKGYIGLPFIIGANLFLQYSNNNSNNVLFKYDGENLTAVPSPAGFNNSFRGYEGQPVYYNDNLYLRYRSNNGNYVLFKYEDSSLNIEEHINKEELFTVYPNPAKDVLNIQYLVNQRYEITIYTSLGKLLATYENADNNFQVPVDHLANGLYFITVQDESGKTATLKFVKN